MECWSNVFIPSNIRFSGPGGESVLSESRRIDFSPASPLSLFKQPANGVFRNLVEIFFLRLLTADGLLLIVTIINNLKGGQHNGKKSKGL